jgi:hypothetical protein
MSVIVFFKKKKIFRQFLVTRQNHNFPVISLVKTIPNPSCYLFLRTRKSSDSHLKFKREIQDEKRKKEQTKEIESPSKSYRFPKILRIHFMEQMSRVEFWDEN